MTELQYDDRQLKEIVRALQKLYPRRILPPLLNDFGGRVIREMEVYPPPAENSERTGQLGRSWYHKVFGLDVTIGNLATYAGYVHGEEQRPYHGARGWKKLLGVVEDEADKLVKAIERKIDAIWRR